MCQVGNILIELYIICHSTTKIFFTFSDYLLLIEPKISHFFFKLIHKDRYTDSRFIREQRYTKTEILLNQGTRKCLVYILYAIIGFSAKKKKKQHMDELFGINEFVIQLVYLTFILSLIIKYVVDVYLNADLPHNGVLGSWLAYKINRQSI